MNVPEPERPVQTRERPGGAGPRTAAPELGARRENSPQSHPDPLLNLKKKPSCELGMLYTSPVCPHSLPKETTLQALYWELGFELV